MKRNNLLLILVCVGSLLMCILFGCNKEKDEFKIVDGVINYNDVTINFNSNSITNKDIVLAIIEDNESIDDGLISTLYSLEIPNDFNNEIEISFSINNNLTDITKALLGVGVDYINDKEQTQKIFFHFPTSLKDDKIYSTFSYEDLVQSLECLGESSDLKPKNMRLYLGVFQDGCYFEDEGHFKVWFPSGFSFSSEERLKFLNDLEIMFNYYKTLGYDLKDNEVIDIHLKRGISDVGFYQPIFNDITIRADYFQPKYKKEEILPILYHEFFHYIQFKYCNIITALKWFNEATASYYEALLSNGTITTATSECYELLFTSVIPTEDTARNGYARCPLIAYISKIKGNDSWIIDLYKNGVTNSKIEDLMSDISIFFPSDFYTALAMGEVGDKLSYMHYKEVEDNVNKNCSFILDVTLPELIALQEASNGEFTEAVTKSFSIFGGGSKFVAISFDENQLKTYPSEDRINISSEKAYQNIIRINKTTCELMPNELTIGELRESIEKNDLFLMILTNTGYENKTFNGKISIQYKSSEEQVIVQSLLKTGKWKFSGHSNKLVNGNISLNIGFYRSFELMQEYDREDLYGAIIKIPNSTENKTINICSIIELTGDTQINNGTSFRSVNITIRYLFDGEIVTPDANGKLTIGQVGELVVQYTDEVMPDNWFDIARIILK